MNSTLRAIEEEAAERRARWKVDAQQKWKKLNIFQKIYLINGGRICIGSEQLVPERPDNHEVKLYLFYCPVHDEVDIDYEQHYSNTVYCSRCLHEPAPKQDPLRPQAVAA